MPFLPFALCIALAACAALCLLAAGGLIHLAATAAGWMQAGGFASAALVAIGMAMLYGQAGLDIHRRFA